MVIAAEQQADAPKGAQSDHHIDDSADNAGLSTTDPGHEVKLEKANQAPVDAADNQRVNAILSNICFLSFGPSGPLTLAINPLVPIFPVSKGNNSARIR